MYTLTRKLSVVCLTVVLSFLVYGCGGSSKQVSITDVSTDMVTAGLTPDSGTYNIQPGETATAGDVTFACPAEGSSCEVTVTEADDGSTTVTSAGGMATAMTSDSAVARLAAEQRATDAEAAQMAAENMRDAAVTARTEAENMRDAAVTARTEAENMRDAAVTARTEAENMRNAAVTDRMAAEQRATDAAAAQMAAEQRATDAEAAQMAAEQRATDAEAAQMTAEQRATDAEAAQMTAEQRATDAEAAQMAAENMRDAAVTARTEAENMRDAAVTARTEAENMRDAAVTARTEAENMRDAAVTARTEAENMRNAAVTDRMAAEQRATDAEAAQMTAEQRATDAEAAQMTAEQRATDAEAAQMTAEQRATDAEAAQMTAEQRATDAEAAQMVAEVLRDAALEELRLATLRAMPNTVDITTLELNYRTITAGTYNLRPGQIEDVGDATFTCPAGGLACEVTVAIDGTVTSAGGKATAQNSMAANDSKMAIALTAPNGALLTNAATDAPTIETSGVEGGVERAPNGDITITLTPVADGDDTKYTPETVDSGHDFTTRWMGLTLKRNNAIAETDTDHAEPATSMDEATFYTNIVSAKAEKLTYKQVPDPDGIDAVTGVNTLPLAINPNQDAADVNDDEKFTGYYIRKDSSRIRGTFKCTTEDCVAITIPDATDEGNLILGDHLTGWAFESDNDEKEGRKRDPDYMYFGYWLKSPVNPSVAVSDYQFATLFGGKAMFDLTSALLQNDTDDSLKAKYEGGAAGRYVTRELRIINGGLDTYSPGSHGRFTAKAKLTAYFGADPAFNDITVTPNVININTINGSITEFKDGTKDLGFEVTLVKTEILETPADGVSVNGDTTGTKMFNDGPAMGSWSANFYGPSALETSNKRDTDADTLPSGVAGQFNVGSSYTRVIGAFAAKKQ